MNVVALLICNKTGKRYVGVAKNASHRPTLEFNPLHYGHGPLIRKAIKRWGAHNFGLLILGSGFRSRKALYAAERWFIKLYGTLHPNGYNVTSGGSGPTYGPEFRLRVKRAMSRPEVKRRNLIGNRIIRARNKAWRRNLRAAVQRTTRTTSWRRKNLAANRRKARDPNYLRKLRRSTRHLYKDPRWLRNVRKSMPAGMRRRSKNPEWLRNVRLAARKRAKDPQWSRKMRAAARRRSKNRKWLCNVGMSARKRSRNRLWLRNMTHARWHVRRGIVNPNCPLCCSRS
jgi:group I intron endonuclease